MAAVRASGGVILRDGCVLVVHRSHYDDWTLPKGKLERGESWEQAALREVEEETGLRCTLGEAVGAISYLDGAGREKEVRYFRMDADGEPAPHSEIDEVRWLPLSGAASFLTYARDAELLAHLR